MSTIRVNNIVDAGGGNAATLNGVNLRPGMIDSNNRIVNGAFDFWQRGTSFSTAGYGADRWVQSFLGGTMTVSRQPFTLGDTLGQSNPKYFLRQSVSGQSLSTHFASVQQRIEGVASYAGQTVTVLGWARRSSGAGSVYVQLSQQFGSGGSPSTAVFNAFQQVALSSSWQPFAYTTTLPSVAGKTLGTNGNDYLQLDFYSSLGTSYGGFGVQTIDIDLWGIHIKVGTHTTDAVTLYNVPELGPELARCQRYYTKLGGEVANDIIVQGVASTSAAMAATLTLPVTMRAAPTLSKVGTWSVFNAGQPSVVATSTTTCSINFAGTVASLGPASVSTSGTTTFLTADAEL